MIRAQARREWSYDRVAPTGELAGKHVLIVGAGSIGTAVKARLEPFDVTFTLVARSARPAEGVHAVAELPKLLPAADVVVVLVPLTDATRGLIDGTFLAAMPRRRAAGQRGPRPGGRHRGPHGRAGDRADQRCAGRHRPGAAAGRPPALDACRTCC